MKITLLLFLLLYTFQALPASANEQTYNLRKDYLIVQHPYYIPDKHDDFQTGILTDKERFIIDHLVLEAKEEVLMGWKFVGEYLPQSVIDQFRKPDPAEHKPAVVLDKKAIAFGPDKAYLTIDPEEETGNLNKRTNVEAFIAKHKAYLVCSECVEVFDNVRGLLSHYGRAHPNVTYPKD